MSETILAAVITAVGAVLSAIVTVAGPKLFRGPRIVQLARAAAFATLGFSVACTLTVVVAVLISKIVPKVPLPTRNYPRTIVLSPLVASDGLQDPAAWEDFREYLEERLHTLKDDGFTTNDISVSVTASSTYEDQLEALKSGTITICGLSAGTTATASSDPIYHYRPVFELAYEDGTPVTYSAVFIVNSNNRGVTDLQTLADYLKKVPEAFEFGQRASLSSYIVPLLVLENGFNVSFPNSIKTPTTRKHPDLISRVASGKVFAACVAGDVLYRSPLKDRVKILPTPPANILNEKGLSFLTKEFPSVSFGWRDDLPMPLQLCLEQAFTSHQWTNDAAFRRAYERNPRMVAGLQRIDGFWSRWKNVFSAQMRVDKSFKP